MPSQRGTKSLSWTFKLNVPSWWNDLPNSIPAAESLAIFKNQLKTYSVTVVTSVPWDTERVLRLDKDAYGKKPFFSWTEVYFNHAVKLHVKNEPMGRQRSCTNLWRRFPPDPAKMGGESGYISGRFAIGSSGYFDWSDDWVVQLPGTAKYAVLVPYLREPRLRQ